MWIPVEPVNVAYGPATPSTSAVPQNLSTNYGGPRLMETDTTQNFPFGFRVRAVDPILGFGEFIYLAGVASTVAGSVVNYNPFTGATTLNVPAAATDALRLRLRWLPRVANLFGWYQVAGVAVVANNATAAAGNAVPARVRARWLACLRPPARSLMGAQILTANGSTFTKVGTTRNGSSEVFFSNLDGVFVGCPISGTGIPGGATVAAGYNNSPNSRNSSAGSAAGLIMSAAATADGTVTVTFTRTNFSLLGGQITGSRRAQIT
jgi:hypothetical protein